MKEKYVVIRGTTKVFEGTVDECMQKCVELDNEGIWDMEIMEESAYIAGIIEMRAIGML